MNTFTWLLKREYWEHRGGLLWAPVAIGMIIITVVTITLATALAMGHKHGIHINGAAVNNLSEVMSEQDKAEFAMGLAAGYMGTSMPMLVALSFVVFFFALGALYDERKDRSVLFWKSLPVSDTSTVLSKVAIALVVAPLITLAVATITSGIVLLITLIGAAFAGANAFGPVLTSSTLYLAPLQLLGLLPVYAAWALPTVGWLLMVSAWARTKPFLWAVGAPVMGGALISWFDAMFEFGINIEWMWQHVIARGLLSVVPGTWFGFTNLGNDDMMELEHHGLSEIFRQSWAVFSEPTLWIGAVLGVAMIFAAIRLRKWRDEG
jgi:ABC-2 type transport system permease protein